MGFESVWQWFESRSTLAVFWYGLALAGIIEGVTCLFRFGLGLQATRDTGWMAVLTFGYRIHHGYIGVVLVIPALLLSEGRVRHLLLLLGIGLLVSDAIHHFLVLWPITGSPEFDIRYPGY